MRKGKTTGRKVVTAKTLLTNVEAAKALLTDEEAADLIGETKEAGIVAGAANSAISLLFRALIEGKYIRNHSTNRETFAKAQLLNASLIQLAFALGIQEGERRAEEGAVNAEYERGEG